MSTRRRRNESSLKLVFALRYTASFVAGTSAGWIGTRSSTAIGGSRSIRYNIFPDQQDGSAARTARRGLGLPCTRRNRQTFFPPPVYRG
jgi:hypothetical protein